MFNRLRHMTLPEPPKAVWNGYTVSFLLLLVAIGWRITLGLEQHMDVLLWDEANYLNRGLWMFDRIPKVWGPTYSAWYKFLSCFESDKVGLYYLNYRVMTIGTGIIAFLFLTVSGVRPWIAFVLSAYLLLSSFNLPVWPKISHYCIGIVMVSLIAGSFTRDLLARSCLFTLGLLITAFARPELFLAFSASLLLALILAAFTIRRRSRSVQTLFAFTLLLAVAFCWFYKTPFNSGDSGRSIKVFYQHYSLNFIREHHLNLNWWLDWETIIAQNFKHPESLRSILQYDAPVFFHHLAANTITFISNLASMASQLLLPWKTQRITPLLFGLAGLALYLLPFRFSGFGQRMGSSLKQNAGTLIALLIFILPGILVCIYAYPRAHYLVIFLPVMLLLIGLLLNSLQPADPSDLKTGLAILTGALMVWLGPSAKDFEFYQLERKQTSLANVKNIAFLQQWESADTIRIFDLEGDISSMLRGHFRGYTNDYLLQRPKTLMEFIDKHQIAVIYVTPPMQHYGPLQRDTSFRELMNNPEKLHFYRVKTGNFEPYLLIRKTP